MEVSYSSISVVLRKTREVKYWLPLLMGTMAAAYPVLCEEIVMSALPMQISGWFCVFGKVSCGLLIFVVFPVFAISLLALLLPWKRHISFFANILSLSVLMGLGIGMIISSELRTYRFAQLADRAKPLVAAIEKFDREKGRAPSMLNELVPNYLPSVPGTGIGVYPNYEYERLKQGKNRWQLTVNCSSGFLNCGMNFITCLQKIMKSATAASLSQ